MDIAAQIAPGDRLFPHPHLISDDLYRELVALDNTELIANFFGDGNLSS
jgi:hypothetical protein